MISDVKHTETGSKLRPESNFAMNGFDVARLYISISLVSSVVATAP